MVQNLRAFQGVEVQRQEGPSAGRPAPWAKPAELPPEQREEDHLQKAQRPTVRAMRPRAPRRVAARPTWQLQANLRLARQNQGAPNLAVAERLRPAPQRAERQPLRHGRDHDLALQQHHGPLHGPLHGPEQGQPLRVPQRPSAWPPASLCP